MKYNYEFECNLMIKQKDLLINMRDYLFYKTDNKEFDRCWLNKEIKILFNIIVLHSWLLKEYTRK